MKNGNGRKALVTRAWKELKKIKAMRSKLERQRRSLDEMLLKLFGQGRTLHGEGGLVLRRQTVRVEAYKVEAFQYDRINEAASAEYDLFPDLFPELSVKKKGGDR